MSRRLPAAAHCTLLLLCFAATVLPAAAATQTDPHAAQRERFARVLATQAVGRHAQAAKLVRGLEDYPLYPYYLYDDLRRRLHEFPTTEVARFLSAYPGSLLATRLRDTWLTQLARSKRWPSYLDFYQVGDDPTLRCHQLVARFESGQLEGALTETRATWLNGESLPEACDPAFARLYASELMTDDLVWQRIALAMKAGNRGLAAYLARRLDDARLKRLHALWDEAHRQPHAALARGGLDDDAATRTILLHALARLARGDLAAAERAWERLQERHAWSTAERGEAFYEDAKDEASELYASAATQALRACLGSSTGAFQNAMTASPMNLSMVPRSARITSDSGVNSRFRKRISSCALMPSEMRVNPRTSANSNDTSRVSPPSCSLS